MNVMSEVTRVFGAKPNPDFEEIYRAQHPETVDEKGKEKSPLALLKEKSPRPVARLIVHGIYPELEELFYEEPTKIPPIDFTDVHFMWEMYSEYTYKHSQKNCSHMMQPGVFCEYFSIHLFRAKEESKPWDMKTFLDIIDELTDRDVIYTSHPCGPRGYMSIYQDQDGDQNPILSWQT